MSGWEPDNSAATADAGGGDTWNAGTSGGDNWGNGGDAANDGGFGADFGEGLGDDGPRKCRNCGEEGHVARDCTEPRQLTGECYNCGEVGHNKADCPNPKVIRPFTGECRICHQEGHPAAECPEKPADKCRICGQEGHKAVNCASKRVDIFPEDLPECTAEEAWTAMLLADTDKDVNVFKTAVLAYAKTMLGQEPEDGGEGSANSGVDLADIEKGFRDDNCNFHFIAKEREIPDTMTIIGLNGSIDQKYVLTFQLSDKPARKKFAEGWPDSNEENLERLKNCGFPMDRLVPKCGNCGQMGHIRKHCREEKVEPAGRVVVTCYICNETGHRARDCTQERVDPNLCRNCKQPGHNSKECPEPRNADNVECKRCGQMGHFGRDCPDNPSQPMTCRNCGEEGHKAADCEKPRVVICRNCGKDGHTAKDCTEPKNPANNTCRNCDEVGHFTRECPKPRDWSKVQCRNCGEYGHGAARCPEPKEPTIGEMDAGNGGGWDNSTSAAEGGWDNNPSADGGDAAWANSTAEPVSAF